MFILFTCTLFILCHLISDCWTQGYQVYQNPRCWLQVLTIVLVVYVAGATYFWG
jgi:hypothetical protein